MPLPAPHPLCTKCPTRRDTLCPECAIHRRGPADLLPRLSYQDVSERQDRMYRLLAPADRPMNEEERFYYRLRWLDFLYSAGWTEQQYEGEIAQEFVSKKVLGIL